MSSSRSLLISRAHGTKRHQLNLFVLEIHTNPNKLQNRMFSKLPLPVSVFRYFYYYFLKIVCKQQVKMIFISDLTMGNGSFTAFHSLFNWFLFDDTFGRNVLQWSWSGVQDVPLISLCAFTLSYLMALNSDLLPCRKCYRKVIVPDLVTLLRKNDSGFCCSIDV